MRRSKKWFAVLIVALMGLQFLGAAEFFVSATTGDNKNAGTKEAPMKNIDAAIKKAKAGDTINVAEGVYMGTFNIGYLEIDKALIMKGGYSKNFAERNPVKFPTLFQPDNASAAKARKALIALQKNTDGFVLDGFVLDMGMRNSYSSKDGKPEGSETGLLLLPPNKNTGENATAEEPILRIQAGNAGGSIKIINNVFVNGANFAIQGGIPKGKIEINNNVFVSNRMASIEVWGTHGTEIAEADITDNTILFTWSRLKDFMDMGYGVRIMTKMKYRIANNIIGTAILTGVDNTRFAKNEHVTLDNNVFFMNKQSDLEYSPASNTKLNLATKDFGDLAFASVKNNKNELPKGLVIDKAYLEGFVSARYTEKLDYDANSEANRMRELFGLNKQGKMTTTVSMFANRYPWKATLGLFGAVNGVGAQGIK
jgi:hypothetical protein